MKLLEYILANRRVMYIRLSVHQKINYKHSFGCCSNNKLSRFNHLIL